MAEAGDRGLKRFHGDVEDPGKALRQWKSWALAKMMTMKDLSPMQKAPWIYTLLDGSAWEAVEHLTRDSLELKVAMPSCGRFYMIGVRRRSLQT